MEMQVGQVVFSKAGRDKTKAFVILSVVEEYAYIIDGRARPFNKPKKKKMKHLQPVNHLSVELIQEFTAGVQCPITLDARIRCVLKRFEKSV